MFVTLLGNDITYTWTIDGELDPAATEYSYQRLIDTSGVIPVSVFLSNARR